MKYVIVNGPASCIGPLTLAEVLDLAKARAKQGLGFQRVFKLVETHYIKAPAEPEVVEVP